jgi:hypothetical protein
LDAVDALLPFAAALVSLRLAGGLLGRWRARRDPALVTWAAALAAYALASAALAWGASAGWDGRAFRAYYLFGGLLTAPLLGLGSLQRAGRRWAGPLALVYGGLAIGVAVAMPLHGAFPSADLPAAADHLKFLPGRLVAVAGNTLGTVAVVGVAALTIRKRPVGNLLIVGAVALAGIGSAFSGLGEAATGAFLAGGAALLYAGVRSDR